MMPEVGRPRRAVMPEVGLPEVPVMARGGVVVSVTGYEADVALRRSVCVSLNMHTYTRMRDLQRISRPYGSVPCIEWEPSRFDTSSMWRICTAVPRATKSAERALL